MVSQLEPKGEDYERQQALFSHNAIDYANLCNEQGIEPEDSTLYEVGLFEQDLDLQERIREDFLVRAREIRKIQEQIRIRRERFVRLGSRVSLRIHHDTETKRHLLQDCFPEKFGLGGKQDVTDYSIGRIGILFENVLDFYSNDGN